MKKSYRITEIGEEYALIDSDGTVVRTDSRPRNLSNIAFSIGADEVRHEYDLRKAEEATWRR